MKPAPFTYHAPRSLDEALSLLSDLGDDAKVLAGGQSLMPILNFRLTRFEHLIDINRIGAEFSRPKDNGDTVTIPALVRQRTAERSPEIAMATPIFGQALKQVAHPQIRNRGTVCGSLAHADPAAELPSVVSVLDSTFTLASARRTREVDVADFFQFHLTTAIEPDEMLTGVTFRRPKPGTHTAFHEFATRKGDFALAGVAVAATVDTSGAVTDCRIAAAGVAPTPQRLTEAENLLIGSTLDSQARAAAAEAARATVDPTGDIHASAEHRRRLTGVLVLRALVDVARQGGKP
ncbi:xanthine dehydrogenase family protein subunit M [Kibdelosporangium philippinense]|uniref:Xanthine dehydrogenase family protein subunit M n=1 Tax=Kibdelosporangium philippinense TaxID=211113 RepID=A0ABS8Z2B0_9PSEU|nr:xanthine dehydrogenase family protein subunit M [Kibdelosporangium philippinense]MCE7002069.1 xanthine dehydrogenase family protein subunit M [Kibdelosporangium philippinense]